MQFSIPKKGRKILINVTSLIDVMFLLLIFFLVSSTFRDQPAINLVLPDSTTAEATAEGPAVLYLTSDGKVYLNGDILPGETVQEALRQLQAETGDDRIVLRADTQSEHGFVVDLIDTVKKSGFTKVSLSAKKIQQ